MDTVRGFRYGMSRAGVVLLTMLLGIAGLLVIRYILIDLNTPGSDTLPGLILIMLITGGVLAPVPAMEIIWWARGRVIVQTGGLRWRGWSTWKSREWGELLGVGMPPPDATRTEDERIHLITRDGHEFVHGFGLRGRQDLAEAIRQWGGLNQIEVVGRYTILCRPSVAEEVVELAKAEIQPMPDPLDFWAGRFRRF